MSRYAKLLWLQVRTSLVTSLQYRWEFILEGVMSVFWAVMSLVPLWVFGGMGRVVAGWNYAELVVLFGWFTILKGLLDGGINPSLQAVVEHIRKGTLDFILLKPADAQFLLSTAKFSPWKMVDVPTGFLLAAFGFHMLGRWPAFSHIGAALLLLVGASLVLYSMWILAISAAFWVVRLDNLSFLFQSVFDFARWPVSIFKGSLRILFTFLIPLAIMTTYPVLALLGRLELSVGAAVFVGAIIFVLLSRFVWLRAIGHYTSASS